MFDSAWEIATQTLLFLKIPLSYIIFAGTCVSLFQTTDPFHWKISYSLHFLILIFSCYFSVNDKFELPSPGQSLVWPVQHIINYSGTFILNANFQYYLSYFMNILLGPCLWLIDWFGAGHDSFQKYISSSKHGSSINTYLWVCSGHKSFLLICQEND